MELLLRTECDNLILYNSDKLIFKADEKFLDISGKEISAKGIDYCVELKLEQHSDKKEICGTSKFIMSKSVIPAEIKVEDVCGLFSGILMRLVKKQ